MNNSEAHAPCSQRTDIAWRPVTDIGGHSCTSGSFVEDQLASLVTAHVPADVLVERGGGSNSPRVDVVHIDV